MLHQGYAARLLDTMQEERLFEYDVALSFAGEDRSYVEGIAEALRTRGIRVFYDRFERADLWGKDLYGHLDEIYRKKARFCLMFLSKSYVAKIWTSHERRSAQARALSESREYILPVRLDNTEIEGLPPTIGYIDAAEVDATELAQIVAMKLLPPADAVAPQVGLFIDLDYVHWLVDGVISGPGAASVLLEYAREFGSVACRWAVADVSVVSRREVAQALARSDFLIATSEGRSDLALLERITEETLSKRLDIYVLVTGDGDFYEKIKSLLDLGKTVRLVASRRGLNRRFSELLAACRQLQEVGGSSRLDFQIDVLEEVILDKMHNNGLNRTAPLRGTVG